MEFSQKRNGMFDVYDRGEWVGIAAQLSTGQYAFIGRFNDRLHIGLTLDGLAALIKQDEVEELEEDENGIFIES